MSDTYDPLVDSGPAVVRAHAAEMERLQQQITDIKDAAAQDGWHKGYDEAAQERYPIIAQGRRDLADATERLIDARAALTAAEAKIADYENCITWDTTCTGCAAHLDASYAADMRAETAEAKLARVRELAERHLANISIRSETTSGHFAARILSILGATTGETT